MNGDDTLICNRVRFKSVAPKISLHSKWRITAATLLNSSNFYIAHALFLSISHYIVAVHVPNSFLMLAESLKMHLASN